MPSARDDDVAAVAADLYAAPLDRFTAARNDLAKSLAAAGRTDEAAAVKALKKPSVAVWTINQLARSHDDLMNDLLAARSHLRDASSGAEMRAAVEQRKRAVSALLTVARDVLDEAGHAATGQTIDSISRALLTASDEETEEKMRRGVLDREPLPADLDDDLEAAFADVSSSPTDDRARDEAERLAGLADEAERAARELRWQADRARDEAERSARVADAAEEKAARARAKADDALRKLT